LRAEGFESGVGDFGALALDRTRVEAGIAHQLHTFRGDMRYETRDEVESRAGDGLLRLCRGVKIPIGDLLAIVAGQMGSRERWVTEVAPNVLRGIEAFGIEAVGVDLKAVMIDVSLGNDALQGGIMRPALAQALAEQVAPFGGKSPARHLIDVDPDIAFETALRHDEVNVRFEAEVAAKGLRHVDHAHPHAGVKMSEHSLHRLGGHLQQVIQERTVGMEEGPQRIIGGQGQMQVRHFEQIGGDGIDPLIYTDLASAWAETAFTAKWNTEVEAAIWAFVPGVTGFGIAAHHHPLHGLSHVSALIGRDFVFEPQVAPAVKMVAKNLTKQIGAGRTIRAKRERKNHRSAKRS
jgi:hypothetical protein